MNKTIVQYKAFTILELMITLVLVSIVVLIIYKALSSAGQVITIYKQNQSNINTVKRFKTLFEYDLDNSLYVTNVDDNIYVITRHDDTIRYQLQKQIIVTRKNNIDTFDISTTKVKISYVEKYTSIPLVKKISLSFDKPFKIDSALLIKYYTSLDLLTIDKNF